jgi:hypothetical protein
LIKKSLAIFHPFNRIPFWPDNVLLLIPFIALRYFCPAPASNSPASTILPVDASTPLPSAVWHSRSTGHRAASTLGAACRRRARERQPLAQAEPSPTSVGGSKCSRCNSSSTNRGKGVGGRAAPAVKGSGRARVVEIHDPLLLALLYALA